MKKIFKVLLTSLIVLSFNLQTIYGYDDVYKSYAVIPDGAILEELKAGRASDIYFKFYNNSKKDIISLSVQFYGYNSFDEKVRDTNGWDTYHTGLYDVTFKPETSVYLEKITLSNEISYIKFDEIKVKYKGNTVDTYPILSSERTGTEQPNFKMDISSLRNTEDTTKNEISGSIKFYGGAAQYNN